jgi:hypothetical protein
MTPRAINQALIVCVCRRPICLQVIPGETVRASCVCGNVVIQSFQKIFTDRKAELRYLIDREPANRWEAIGIELLIDELNELKENY